MSDYKKPAGLKALGKRITACLAAASCAGTLLLTGCHGSRGSNEFLIPETFDTAKSIELTFWAKNDTNKTQTRIYEKAIKDFEALYPNVTVNMRLYTDYGKIYNDVITNISTNTTPNVCITYPDNIATYMTGSNVVVPMDDLIADPKYGLGGSELLYDGPAKEEVIPEFLEECRLGEHIYALPYMRSTEACYVNKTYVEKLGYTLPDVLTWDFVWEVSEAATAKDANGNYAVNGQKTMIPFIYKSTDNMMIQMLKQLDAPYSKEDGTIEIFNDTTRSLLKEIAGHAQTGAFSTFKISSYPANFLNAGQCIFAIDSTAGATWMGMNAPLSDIAPDKAVEFETAVRAVPQYDTGNPKMISQGPSVCIFNKADPQVVLASWLFTQYLLTNEVQIAYAHVHYDVKIKATKMFIENTTNTFVTPVFNGSASLRDAAGQLVEDVTKSVKRKAVVDDAYIDDLFGRVTALYRLDKTAAATGGKAADLGPLPGPARALIGTLVVVWVLIGIYAGSDYLKTKKKKAA